MFEDVLLDVSREEEVILDPFMGSGSTLLASERTRRTACGIELDPTYVDVCVRRWEELTGEQAVHMTTDLTFAETAAERQATL
jgi:DNA modification methylase